jgi:cytoskeletal protein RodZ
MAKREPETEPLDEEPVEAEIPTVGERLRSAREEKKLSLEDVAAQTRIPLRHLQSIENAEWDNLPAPTYTVGFAKSYASAVGLDRTEIGDQLREEMGGQRFAATSADVFEPADPRRTMPRSLVIGAIVGVLVLIVLFTWLQNRSLEQPTPEANVASAGAPAPAQAVARPTPQPQPAPGQPVVLTATDAVWLQVSERGGPTLFSGMLQPGQTYAVPATAAAPVLKTGKPESLKITVGNNVAPPVGPPATTVSNVSLLSADLMKAPGTPAPAAAAPAPRAAAPVAKRVAPPPAAPETTEPATNTGE